MKIKNKLAITAFAGLFALTTVHAQETISQDKTVIQVPPGRTTVEIAPGATESTTTVVESPEAITVGTSEEEATVVTEPAGASWNFRDRFSYDDASIDELYPDREMTIDLFGAFFDTKRNFSDAFDDSQRDGRWGAGAGINMFVTRHLGFGADAWGLDNDGKFVDAASASVILRLPIDVAHLAPYAFGGGGRQFEGRDTWTLHGGAGIEFRLNQHTGIFVDGRYVWPEDRNLTDYTLLRSGLRFAF